MPSKVGLLKKYVWIVDALSHGQRLTFEEISDKWLVSNRWQEPLVLRTFHRYRKAIRELFGIDIVCSRRKENTYYIENNDSEQSEIISRLFTEPAVDTVQTVILPPAEIPPPVKNTTESKSSAIIEETTLDEKDTSEVKTPQKVVHWMVILTAQRTRGLARKLREQGDTLWDEHTRIDIEAWVDTQTDSLPELRKDCYEEIQRNIEKIKRGS